MELKSFKNGIENVPSLKPGAIFHNIDQIKVKRVLEGLKGHATLVIKVHIKKLQVIKYSKNFIQSFEKKFLNYHMFSTPQIHQKGHLKGLNCDFQ